MPAHALLSPSSAHMWLNCPPSAKLSAKYDDQGSTFSRQGTDAHELCQYKLEKALGRATKDPTEDLDYYDAEMENCAEDYASFVMEVLAKEREKCSDPVVLIEQHLDFSRFVPEGFGRGDCLIVSDGTLHVIDMKYGVGVLVSAEKNPQMMCYALGAIELLDSLYDIDKISLTIFQPRRENISTYETTKDELLKWADEVLTPIAKLAYDGEGSFKAGDHCTFCKAKAICRKRAEENLKLAKYDFQKPPELDDLEVAEILTQVDALVSWASDIKDFALQQALSGKHYDGFKVVAGRSTRKFTDEDAVAQAALKAGVEPYEKKLLGITALTAAMGKKQFEQVLGPYICKSEGKPALVPENDKRPALNTAADDFK